VVGVQMDLKYMEKILNIIKKVGIIGITVMLVFVIYQVIDGYQTTINNHIEHSNTYIRGNTEVMVGVKGALEANTVQLQRIEQVLDNKL